MTFYLIAAMVVAFGLEISVGDPAAFMLGGALVPYNLTHDVTLGMPVWLTPLTSLALHANALHLASNALVLLAAGPEVEGLCGAGAYLAFFLLCGIAGGLAQVTVAPGSHEPIIGASGAISGILGAYVARFPLNRTAFGIPVVVPILLWATVQCVESGVFTAATPLSGVSAGTAYAAHVGGFVFALMTIGLFTRDGAKV